MEITYESDEGNAITEELIKELEKKINREYSQASKEAEEKLREYLKKFDYKDSVRSKYVASQYLRYQSGEITFDEYVKDKDAYIKWRVSQIANGKRWEELSQNLAEDMTHANEMSQALINDSTFDAYAVNHNYGTYMCENQCMVNTSYTLFDHATVERLYKSNPNLLPMMSDAKMEAIRLGKVQAWNLQKVNSAVLQGILQGESIPKLAKRMRDVATMGYKQSLRTARTMMTSAQNGGRLDSYKRVQDMGIEMQKQWLATIDNRTRHNHRLLNMQTVPINKPFRIEGYELEYPADPSGEPEMVYNCRCTMVSVFDGYDKKITDFDIDERLGDMTYEEWKESKDIKSYPIDKQERQSEAIKQQYISEYKAMAKEIEQEAEEPKEIHTTHDEDYKYLKRDVDEYEIKYKEVKELDTKLTEDEIIEKLAGGDETKGSCASLAICYASNNMGLDVTDFRGGNSQELFSDKQVNERMFALSEAKMKSYVVQKEASETAEIISGLDKDKKYILAVGRHMAVIRNTDDGVQYLELQSAKKNGWKNFKTDDRTVAGTLKTRFGCKNTTDKQARMIRNEEGKYEKVNGKQVRIYDISTMKPTEEYKEMLGYINTDSSKQKKGGRGGVR